MPNNKKLVFASDFYVDLEVFTLTPNIAKAKVT